MRNNQTCPECGALLNTFPECRDYLNEMIKWDFEDFTGVGQIHHLTVLSYNLQHPSVYSQKGLENAKRSLVEFILHPMAYEKHGVIDLKNLASDVRDWKITGTAENHGAYTTKPVWNMTAADVVNGGLENYVENVKKWSAEVLGILKELGEIR
ncbi:MAG: DUF5946 family protein [Patescibacteria group bacterium]